ncbi:MAG: rod shape-determining protein MreD [Planctomycetota bacterium]
MNWITFGITTYVCFALQSALGPAWSVGSGVSPNLLLILAVFVGVSARRAVVPWAMLTLGVLLDLLPGPLVGPGVIVGPQALGYLAGAYAVLQLRNLVFRESVFTLVVMVFAVGGFAALVETLVYALRGLPWLADQPLGWSTTEQLWRRLQELLYTAVVALPLGFLLGASRRLWGFSSRPQGDRIF